MKQKKKPGGQGDVFDLRRGLAGMLLSGNRESPRKASSPPSLQEGV